MHHDGVTIGRRFGHEVCTDVATRTAPVVNSHGLPHRLRHLLSNDAGHDVSGAACWKRHNHFDGLGRVGLCHSTEGQCHGEHCDSANLFQLRKNRTHVVSFDIQLYFLPKPKRLAPSMYKAIRSFMKASI